MANAQQQIAELIHGYWNSQAVYIAAKLSIADLLTEKPRTAHELAEVTPAHAPSLYRVLRALASIGIFAEGEDGRFSIRLAQLNVQPSVCVVSCGL